MQESIYFDQSLAAFIAGLRTVLGKEKIESGWIIRDASGRLAFIGSAAISSEEREQAVKAIRSMVGGYCQDFGGVFDIQQPGICSLVDSAKVFIETVADKNGEKITVRLVDRRVVGQDWLVEPAAGWQPPVAARLVFASLKGGVGRSTALAVLAAELARQGRKVLAIDLDLEAPGLGTMLIEENDKPKFGVLDWYVEQGVGNIGIDEERDFLLDMMSPSLFGQGNGLIDVVPAVGRISDTYPANVLAKIARAYLDFPCESGESFSFLKRTQYLIEQLSNLKRYDAVLVDARAGLNETTATALLGLGADILLFGVDTPQTFASYRYLLAHLSRFLKDSNDDWLYRLRMVQAKASPDEQRKAAFRDRAYTIFSEFLYRNRTLDGEDRKPLLDLATGDLITIEQFGVDDHEAPHFAWSILNDSHYMEFDPLANRSQLKKDFYAETYADFINGVAGLLDIAGGRDE